MSSSTNPFPIKYLNLIHKTSWHAQCVWTSLLCFNVIACFQAGPIVTDLLPRSRHLMLCLVQWLTHVQSKCKMLSLQCDSLVTHFTRVARDSNGDAMLNHPPKTPSSPSFYFLLSKASEAFTWGLCVCSADHTAQIRTAPQHYTTKLLRGEGKHNFFN